MFVGWLVLCPVTWYNIIVPIYKKVNKQFFKKWDKDMAYVVGFLCADGYITVNNRGGHFWCISITDKDLLENIKNIIEAEHKISIRKGRGNIKDQYRLQIGSIEMCDDLRNLGIKEQKTKNIKVPNVPKEYLKEFVRGYFDGDGGVWIGLVHKERKKHLLSIRVSFTSCSRGFLKSLSENLEQFGIDGGVLSYGKGDYSRLTYSIHPSLKLYDFMYNTLGTSKLFLKRKKDVFEKYNQMRS